MTSHFSTQAIAAVTEAPFKDLAACAEWLHQNVKPGDDFKREGGLTAEMANLRVAYWADMFGEAEVIAAIAAASRDASGTGPVKFIVTLLATKRGASR
ncbi:MULTISPECIES: hypothetical protein [unclassified Bradyrhizobium]